MMRSKTIEPEQVEAIGIQDILTHLVRKALRDSPDVLSVAIGDRQGLPMINATKGSVPVMTYTAMATMSMKAARTAAEAVGMEPPDYLTVHSSGGILTILSCGGSDTTLVARLKENANLGLALVVLRRLATSVGDALVS